jgi:hypothetical protein
LADPEFAVTLAPVIVPPPVATIADPPPLGMAITVPEGSEMIDVGPLVVTVEVIV